MGEEKYRNYTSFLENNGYEVVSSLETFTTTKKLSYKCKHGHVSSITHTAFANKKAQKAPSDLCSKCATSSAKSCSFETKKLKILNSSGHILLTVDGPNVTYQCATCGQTRQSCYSNLRRSSSNRCGSCISATTKKTLDSVIEDFEQLKIEYDIPQEYRVIEYQNNKCVTFKCNNDHTFTTSYFDLKRGRRCPECADTRRSKTNVERYGAANVFAAPVVKEKIKQTCMTKYGETHHMKVESIRKKAEQTNLHKIGVKYAFHTPESFEKIRKTCVKRYGVEFPLQSKFIQIKVTQRWLEKIGANRPMSDQTYWKQCMLDKYGVDHYSKTDQFKIDYANTCLDKYGVDHYSKTDQFKIDYANTCLDKYGVDHPMKTVEVFQKVIKSSFCRKPFTYPSGRVDFILGYEGIAIAELLETYNEKDIITNVWCIPTFQYKRVSSSLRPMIQESSMSLYYPDILLPDKIIEVKSKYLYKRDKSNVIEKMKAVARTGYTCELWVYKNERKISFKRSYKLVDSEVVIEKIALEIYED
jgi:hypothetical protein